MKNFLLGAGKLATAFVSAIVALAVLGILANFGYEAYKKRQAKPFEETKIWTEDLSQHLGMTLMARTKLVDNSMYLSTNFTGSPPFLTDPSLVQRNRDGAITVSFSDADGFKLHEEKINMSAFTSNVNDKGEKAGLEYQSTKYMDVAQYARIASIGVSWHLETKPIPAVVQRDTPNLLDHCAPNISRAERLKRLGAHGQIRESGKDSYEVGLRSLHFFYDGSLLSCN